MNWHTIEPWSWLMLAFVVGARLGCWSEARIWREKAESGFRKESAGKLYNVTEDGRTPVERS